MKIKNKSPIPHFAHMCDSIAASRIARALVPLTQTHTHDPEFFAKISAQIRQILKGNFFQIAIFL
jgi:hypothetical protein